MVTLRQAMDRLMEDAFISPRRYGGGEEEQRAMMDVYEQGDNLVVEVSLPGVKPDDIDVHVEQGVLSISGEMKQEQERQERNYHVREHRSGRFSRVMQLPPSYDANACEASYEHGMLRLTFPRAEQARPRRIQIGGQGSQPQQVAGEMSGAPRPPQDTGQASGTSQRGGQQRGEATGSGTSGSGTSGSGTSTRSRPSV
jgi:HSP20 family protein